VGGGGDEQGVERKEISAYYTCRGLCGSEGQFTQTRKGEGRSDSLLHVARTSSEVKVARLVRVPVDADEVDRLRVVGVKLVVNFEGRDCKGGAVRKRFSTEASGRRET
jgi:hypothetical protein